MPRGTSLKGKIGASFMRLARAGQAVAWGVSKPGITPVILVIHKRIVLGLIHFS
jgi:hypothetical protein